MKIFGHFFALLVVGTSFTESLSDWCLSSLHIWASFLLTSEFKMAETKESKGGCDVGFFYYDWALSRYRWMDGNCFSKVSGFGPVKKMACSSSEVKAQVGGNRKKAISL